MRHDLDAEDGGNAATSGCELLGGAGFCAGPRHELVDARGGPEIDELVENVDEIGLRIDVVELAGLNQRSDAGPVFRALVMACEERVLTVENDRTDAALDDIRVQFDATVVKEADEPVPMV